MRKYTVPIEFSAAVAGPKRLEAVGQRAAAAVTLRFESMISAFVLPDPCKVAKKQEQYNVLMSYKSVVLLYFFVANPFLKKSISQFVNCC